MLSHTAWSLQLLRQLKLVSSVGASVKERRDGSIFLYRTLKFWTAYDFFNYHYFGALDTTRIIQQIKPKDNSFTSVRANCLSKHFLVLKFTVENKLKLLISIAVLLVCLRIKFRLRQRSDEKSLLKQSIGE